MGNRGNLHHCYAGDIFAKMRDIVFSPMCLIKMGLSTHRSGNSIAFHVVYPCRFWCVKNRGKVEISEVDFDCFDLGKWDSSDFIIKKKNENKIFKVAVKTTKEFGNLLLLEMKDWKVIGEEAIYIPNTLKDKDDGFYHYLVFCRVKTNLSVLLKQCDSIDQTSLSSLAESLMTCLELQVVGCGIM